MLPCMTDCYKSGYLNAIRSTPKQPNASPSDTPNAMLPEVTIMSLTGSLIISPGADCPHCVRLPALFSP